MQIIFQRRKVTDVTPARDEGKKNEPSSCRRFDLFLRSAGMLDLQLGGVVLWNDGTLAG